MIKNKEWTNAEIVALVANYPVIGKRGCMELLGRSAGSIRQKSADLGLKSGTRNDAESNYRRGSGWRGKKRPEHSAWLSEHHPLKGTKRSIATCEKMSKSAMEHFQKFPENTYSHAKRGWYMIEKKKMYFRSLWEANYALYLDFLQKQGEIKKWDYEKVTFWFEAIRRGVRSYCPDFRITKMDSSIEFHEVKGWMDPKSKTKIKRMAKYHPEVKLVIIDGPCYKDIKKKVGKMLNFY